MREWFKRSFLGLLMCSVALFGCSGDDDDESPTGPDDGERGEGSDEAVLLAGTLVQSMQQAFFASLIQDPATVEGEQGTLEIAGNTWTFNGYSPDGLLFIDGRLTVEKDKYPSIPARGQLELSGAQEGELIVDIMVSVGEGMDLNVTGTLQLGDEVWDIAELLAAAGDGEG